MNTEIHIRKKNDIIVAVTVQDETGAAYNLTGCSVSFIVKGGEVTITKTTETDGGIEITNAADGQVEVSLSNTDTNIPSDRYDYEVLITTADGQRYSCQAGKFLVLTSLFA